MHPKKPSLNAWIPRHYLFPEQPPDCSRLLWYEIVNVTVVLGKQKPLLERPVLTLVKSVVYGRLK